MLCVSCYVSMSFKRIITVCILYLAQHFQPWNIGFFPLNKSAIFHRLLNIKRENWVWEWQAIVTSFHIWHAVTWLFKTQRKCNKQKIQWFDVEYGIYFFRETCFFNIFIINDPVSLLKWIPYPTSNQLLPKYSRLIIARTNFKTIYM